MTDPSPGTGATSLNAMPDRIVATHLRQGDRLQAGLRIALVVFVALTLLVLPPARYLAECVVALVGYAVVVGLATWLGRRQQPAHRWHRWLLVVDVTALSAVTVLAGASAVDSWTAYVVVTGFFMLSLLTGTHLDRRLAGLVAVPIVLAYLGSSVAAREANDEPWPALLLRVAVLAAVCAGCVAMVWIHHSRVMAIAELAGRQATLLHELSTLERRERAALSEALHDGALQYVLAARLVLDDLSGGTEGGDDTVERIHRALTEAAALLRTTIAELHPAVLAQAGLVRAVQDLGRSTARGSLEVRVVHPSLPVGRTTSADPVVFGVIREALGNVVKHARASSVQIELGRAEGSLLATVTDNGRGLDPGVLSRRVAEGHIGLASQRLRVEAVGGTLRVTPNAPCGTRLECRVPLDDR